MTQVAPKLPVGDLIQPRAPTAGAQRPVMPLPLLPAPSPLLRNFWDTNRGNHEATRREHSVSAPASQLTASQPTPTAHCAALGALGVRDAISVPGRKKKLANNVTCLKSEPLPSRGHEAGAQRSPLTCVAAHLRRSSLRAAHARSHCVADGARSLRRNAGEAARVCFSRVRFRSRSRCLLVHAPCRTCA